jgi:hypothetical protein
MKKFFIVFILTLTLTTFIINNEYKEVHATAGILDNRVFKAMESLFVSAGFTVYSMTHMQFLVTDAISNLFNDDGKTIDNLNTTVDVISGSGYSRVKVTPEEIKAVKKTISKVISQPVQTMVTPIDNTYQQWINFVQTPYLTSTYPYQYIKKNSINTKYLILSKTPLYVDTIGYGGDITNSTHQIYYLILTSGAWVTPFNQVQSIGNDVNSTILEANYNIYTNNTLTNIYASKSTLGSSTATLDFNQSISAYPHSVALTPSISADSKIIIPDNLMDSDFVGKNTLVQIPSISIDTTESIGNTIPTTWYENILDKVTSLPNSIATAVKEKFPTAPSPKEETYGLPDLFKLLVMILVALMGLFLAAFKMLLSLSVLPADSSLINPTMKLGIDFMKNCSLPGFNLSFFTLITSVVFGIQCIAIIKLLRKYIHKEFSD